jgi:tyrosine-protein kinase Etk/Wzc
MTERDSYRGRSAAPVEELNVSETPAAVAEISVIEIITRLSLEKWLIAKVVVAAFFLGGIVCFVLPARYTATTKIMPPQQAAPAAAILMNQLVSASTGSIAAAAGMGLGLKSPNDIYVGLLSSRPIADAIIEQFGLAKVYHATDMTSTRKKLAGRTEIASEKDGFISIAVADEDKVRAAQIANAYTKGLRELTKTLAVTEASQRRLFYEEQLAQAKAGLVAAELSFQQVQQNKGLIQLDGQAKTMIEGVARMRAEVAAKEVELQALRSYSTDRNPEVELAERELSSMQTEVAQMEQKRRSTGFADLGLGDVPGAGMDYLQAEHELKYKQTVFDLLVKQYDMARLDEAKDAVIIQVVETAIPPDRRSSPQRRFIVTLFTVVGLLAACSYVLVHAALQRDPELSRSLEVLKATFVNMPVADVLNRGNGTYPSTGEPEARRTAALIEHR